MAKFKDMQMPEYMGEENEEMDLFADEKKEEGQEMSKLVDFSDDELIDELKSRGFEIEEADGEMAEEMPMSEEEEELPM